MIERFFPAPEDAVRRAANTALDSLEFVVQKDAVHEMEASRKRHLTAAVTGGEKLILHFSSTQRSGQRGTLVTGETKKSIVGRLTQKTWTSAVMAQIACNLRNGR